WIWGGVASAVAGAAGPTGAGGTNTRAFDALCGRELRMSSCFVTLPLFSSRCVRSNTRGASRGMDAFRRSAVRSGPLNRGDVSGRITSSEPTLARIRRREVTGSCHSENRSSASASSSFARDIERLSHQSGVRLNFIKNVPRDLQSGQRVGAGHARSAPRNHAGKEVFQLQAQGFVFGDGKRRKPDGHRRFYGESNRLLTRVVQRDVFMGLKQPEFANPLGRDAAGGEIGDAAARKLNAHVGDIHFLRKN